GGAAGVPPLEDERPLDRVLIGVQPGLDRVVGVAGRLGGKGRQRRVVHQRGEAPGGGRRRIPADRRPGREEHGQAAQGDRKSQSHRSSAGGSYNGPSCRRSRGASFSRWTSTSGTTAAGPPA